MNHKKEGLTKLLNYFYYAVNHNRKRGTTRKRLYCEHPQLLTKSVHQRERVHLDWLGDIEVGEENRFNWYSSGAHIKEDGY